MKNFDLSLFDKIQDMLLKRDMVVRGEKFTYTVLQADHLNLLLWGEVTSR
jgi:hypothetical protein